MDDTTFEEFRRLIYEQCGISLGPAKKSLVMGRVRKRMRALEIDDFAEYFRYVTRHSSGEEIVHLLDAISTNVTFFFREPAHLQTLVEMFVERLQRGQRRFRLWSAGCSSGEEPYSMATVLLEAMQRVGATDVDLKLLATDLSTKVLAAAQSGRYPLQSLDAIPEIHRRTLVKSESVKPHGEIEIADEVRRLVVFRRLNLSKPPFPMRGPFDAIFCRNVMIYFDDSGRRRLVQQFERLLRPGGLLIVGHTESAITMLEHLQYYRPSVYRKCAAHSRAVTETARPALSHGKAASLDSTDRGAFQCAEGRRNGGY